MTETDIFGYGNLVPWRNANVHILTHALHYGSSVFEGERAYNGKIFKSREHSERLIKYLIISMFQFLTLLMK